MTNSLVHKTEASFDRCRRWLMQRMLTGRTALLRQSEAKMVVEEACLARDVLEMMRGESGCGV